MQPKTSNTVDNAESLRNSLALSMILYLVQIVILLNRNIVVVVLYDIAIILVLIGVVTRISSSLARFLYGPMLFAWVILYCAVSHGIFMPKIGMVLVQIATLLIGVVGIATQLESVTLLQILFFFIPGNFVFYEETMYGVLVLISFVYMTFSYDAYIYTMKEKFNTMYWFGAVLPVFRLSSTFLMAYLAFATLLNAFKAFRILVPDPVDPPEENGEPVEIRVQANTESPVSTPAPQVPVKTETPAPIPQRPHVSTFTLPSRPIVSTNKIPNRAVVNTNNLPVQNRIVSSLSGELPVPVGSFVQSFYSKP